MEKNLWSIYLLFVLLVLSACQNSKNKINEIAMQGSDEHNNPEFEKLCKERSPNNWMNLREMNNGKFISEKSCWGCMSDDGMSHYCNMEEYKRHLENENK